MQNFFLSKYVVFVPNTVYKQENLVEELRNLGINVPSGNLPSYVRRNWSSHAVHTILGFINKGPQTKMLPVYVIPAKMHPNHKVTNQCGLYCVEIKRCQEELECAQP